MNKRGQSILEYAVLISIVLAAAIGMQTYVKRGLQGRYKAVTDNLVTGAGGNNEVAQLAGPRQYEPYYAESSFRTTTTQESTEAYGQGGVVTRDIVNDRRTRDQGDFQQEGTRAGQEDTWTQFNNP